MIDKLESLKAQFDMILIEGAGGIAVPIYEYSDHFYMTTDLIKDIGFHCECLTFKVRCD